MSRSAWHIRTSAVVLAWLTAAAVAAAMHRQLPAATWLMVHLLLLGAGATAVGLVSGLGEFLGYAVRLLSGWLADRTHGYWMATFIGYGMLFCIPLLALAGSWEIAALLLILERVGKAIRSPSRDTILSHATTQVGRGFGFALHEVLDQVGAVAGPLLFTAAYAIRNDYRDGFQLLWIPAALTVAALVVARLRVPNPEKLETDTGKAPLATDRQGFSKLFWIYAIFTFLGVAGFANFQVISYHWVDKAVVPTMQIPILYAIAMGVDALAALVIGKLYDKRGLVSLAIIPLATLAIPFLGFSSQYGMAVGATVLWGIVMAVHETVMRAAIADITHLNKRAFAYGIFNTIYGLGWLVGGAVMGALYETSVAWIYLFVTAAELLAAVAFIFLHKSWVQTTTQ